MKAYEATVKVLLDPRVIGPDATTEWRNPSNAADYFSNLLSGDQSATILDWCYEPVRSIDDQYRIIEIDPETYEEGEMDTPRRREQETLRNGARLLKRAPLKRHPGINIVLAETPQNMSDDRFATWEENPKTGATYGGHYYDDLELAVHDFRDRVGKD